MDQLPRMTVNVVSFDLSEYLLSKPLRAVADFFDRCQICFGSFSRGCFQNGNPDCCGRVQRICMRCTRRYTDLP
jgi:hypothetical protein